MIQPDVKKISEISPAKDLVRKLKAEKKNRENYLIEK